MFTELSDEYNQTTTNHLDTHGGSLLFTIKVFFITLGWILVQTALYKK